MSIMKNSSIIMLFTLLLLSNVLARGQSYSWDYSKGYLTVTGVTEFNTYNVAGMAEHEAIQLHLNDIYALNATNIGGVIAEIGQGGYVEVYARLLDPNKQNNRGPVVWACRSDATSTNYSGNSITISEVGSDTVGDPIWRHFLTQSGFDNLYSRSSKDIREVVHSVAEGFNYGTLNDFRNVFQGNIPVILSVKAYNATVKRIKVPGIGDFPPFDAFFQPSHDIHDVVDVFKNPASNPNYLMIAAHRGYFRDVPDNSLEALRLAIALNVPMVEVDIQLTKDNVWVLSHDAYIGQTTRTKVPARLQSLYNYYTSNIDPNTSRNYPGIPISELTLCELRPDLCDNACLYGATSGTCEPVWLKQQEADGIVPIPTNESAMFLCKQKVLYDMDKIDKSRASSVSVANSRYDLVWRDVVNTGSQNTAIVKGNGATWVDPQMMIDSFPNVDWTKVMYTPTYFSDTKLANGNIAITQSAIDAWFGNNSFECPGVELIYLQEGDPAYDMIDYIKNTKGKHVIQFPMWPEYCDHIITDERIDYRNSWNWLLDYPSRRPTLIISDRLEVLIQLLQANGLQVGL